MSGIDSPTFLNYILKKCIESSALDDATDGSHSASRTLIHDFWKNIGIKYCVEVQLSRKRLS